ncbi:MAG: Holliday junction resolvase RuvX [Deltaproteobacteria bacterium]|nr:Holliday junction resolvase RuvX [Deltaproteobacteria bacterium]
MRVLALDVGTKRIGVALSDPFGWTAQGLNVLPRRCDRDDHQAILDLCREHQVERVIVGIPLDQEGAYGVSAKRIERFRQSLAQFLKAAGLTIPVEGWDERYSTAEAEERLLTADVSRAKRRKVIDKMAAVVILENYLREHPQE